MSNYGRYLSNQPVGDDYFEGRSQERLASAIERHIRDKDGSNESCEPKLSRLIGLEGSWGCGKSNVIEMMKRNMEKVVDGKKQYHFYTYDAWGHQENLQRRSLLEQLTDDLVRKEMLTKKTKVKTLRGDIPVDKEVTWKERVNYLVERTTESRTETVPMVAWEIKLFALFSLVASLALSTLGVTDHSLNNLEIIGISFGLMILLLIFLAIRNNCNDWVRIWGLYNNEKAETTLSTTFSGLEPSDREFREWMGDVDKDINGKLVLVFDNMDRLPAEKIKELWAMINTFFAGSNGNTPSESDYKNVWVIIPFDRGRLNYAYNGGSADASRKFIEKTFPVVFRVAEPVLSDYRTVFADLLHKAFTLEQLGATADTINRAYRTAHEIPNMREMISFINKMVMYNSQWQGGISLENIAIYILCGNDITSDEKIINGDFLGKLKKMFNYNDERMEEIAALHYGIEETLAGQLPLKRLIRKAFRNKGVTEEGIATYATGFTRFPIILGEMVENMENDIELTGAIRFVCNLEGGVRVDNLNKLGIIFEKYTELKCNDCHEEAAMLVGKAPEETASKVMEEFGKRIQSDKDISGENLYWFWHKIVDAANQRNIKPSTLSMTIAADRYINFLLVNKGDTDGFDIKANPIDLCTYLIDKIASADAPRNLRLVVATNQYKLDSVSKALKEATTKATDNDIPAVNNYFEQLRVIEQGIITFPDDANLKNLVDIRNKMKANIEGNKAYYDVLSLIAVKPLISNALPSNEYSGIEERLFRYTTLNHIWNISSTAQSNGYNFGLMSYLIKEKKKCQGKMTVKEIGRVSTVKREKGLTVAQVLDFIEEQEQRIDFGLLTQSPREIFDSAEWLQYAVGNKQKIANSMLQWYRTRIEEVSVTEFYQNNTFRGSEYWPKILTILIDNKIYGEGVTPKLTELSKEPLALLKRSASLGNVSQFLLNHVDYDKVSTQLHDTVGYLTAQKGRWTLEHFKALHTLIEKSDGKEYDQQFLNNCLLALIEKTDVQNIIAYRPGFYTLIVRDHLNSASDLRKKLEDAAKKDDGTPFCRWCKMIVGEKE